MNHYPVQTWKDMQPKSDDAEDLLLAAVAAVSFFTAVFYILKWVVS